MLTMTVTGCAPVQGKGRGKLMMQRQVRMLWVLAMCYVLLSHGGCTSCLHFKMLALLVFTWEWPFPTCGRIGMTHARLEFALRG